MAKSRWTGRGEPDSLLDACNWREGVAPGDNDVMVFHSTLPVEKAQATCRHWLNCVNAANAVAWEFRGHLFHTGEVMFCRVDLTPTDDGESWEVRWCLHWRKAGWGTGRYDMDDFARRLEPLIESTGETEW